MHRLQSSENNAYTMVQGLMTHLGYCHCAASRAGSEKSLSSAMDTHGHHQLPHDVPHAWNNEHMKHARLFAGKGIGRTLEPSQRLH